MKIDLTQNILSIRLNSEFLSLNPNTRSSFLTESLFFHVKASLVLYSIIYITFHGFNNHLYVLDKTLRIQNTCYILQVIYYIIFCVFLSLYEFSLYLSILELPCLNCVPPGCWH